MVTGEWERRGHCSSGKSIRGCDGRLGARSLKEGGGCYCSRIEGIVYREVRGGCLGKNRMVFGQVGNPRQVLRNL